MSFRGRLSSWTTATARSERDGLRTRDLVTGKATLMGPVGDDLRRHVHPDGLAFEPRGGSSFAPSFPRRPRTQRSATQAMAKHRPIRIRHRLGLHLRQENLPLTLCNIINNLSTARRSQGSPDISAWH